MERNLIDIVDLTMTSMALTRLSETGSLDGEKGGGGRKKQGVRRREGGRKEEGGGEEERRRRTE